MRGVSMKKSLCLLLAAVMILSLTACAGSKHAANSDTETNDIQTKESTSASGDNNGGAAAAKKSVITVTFRDDGRGENSTLWKWLQTAYDSFDKKDSCVLNIAPITACEGDYFAKIALSLQSEKTAPDLVAEDTFQLAT
ncbi:MAG: ABC transporter substrate-binding protein, partial [Chitinophagaceae bacterium]|nr:ABC transporter substrate-binding protein [Chitinophagaceae bacterium]